MVKSKLLGQPKYLLAPILIILAILVIVVVLVNIGRSQDLRSQAYFRGRQDRLPIPTDRLPIPISPILTPTPQPQTECLITPGQYTLKIVPVGTLKGSYSCPNRSGEIDFQSLTPPVPLEFTISIPQERQLRLANLKTSREVKSLTDLCQKNLPACSQICRVVDCDKTSFSYSFEGFYGCLPGSANPSVIGKILLQANLVVFHPQDPTLTCSGQASLVSLTANASLIPL